MLASRLNCYQKTCLNKEVYFSKYQSSRDTSPCGHVPPNGQGSRSLLSCSVHLKNHTFYRVLANSPSPRPWASPSRWEQEESGQATSVLVDLKAYTLFLLTCQWPHSGQIKKGYTLHCESQCNMKVAMNNLENIHMLSERNHLYKATYYMSPFIWNVQNREIHRDGK